MNRRFFLKATVSIAAIAALPKMLSNEIPSRDFYMKLYKHNQFIARRPLEIASVVDLNVELVYANKENLLDFNKMEVYKNNILIHKFTDALVLAKGDSITIRMKIV